MKPNQNIAILDAVRQHYKKAAAKAQNPGCCSTATSCCIPHPSIVSDGSLSDIFSYSHEDLVDLPEDAFMGLGCGNPGAIASIKPGETVLDLGSGGGIDCFIAAKKAGNRGRVVGVDMTPEMVLKAREKVLAHGYSNIDTRLGEIEHLPVADQTVDVIISNCVINLSPDKEKVFAEAFRVLKTGGRLAIADMVATTPLTDEIQKDLSLYVSCIAGAVFVDDLENILSKTGFQEISIRFKETDPKSTNSCSTGKQSADVVKSALVEAIKPTPPVKP